MQLMNERILIDTNVLVYAKDQLSDFHQRAFDFIESYEAEFLVSTKNFSEYLVVTTRGDNPLSSVEDAVEDIQEFSQRFSVVYPSFQSQQRLLTLLQQYTIRGKRIHDMELAAIALASQADGIATFNVKDFAVVTETKVIEP